jgi:hypothetical protein
MLACLVAAFALGISALSWFDAHTAADVKLLLSNEVHLSVGAPRANIYVETVFVSTAANNRAEVVDDIDATLSASGIHSQDLVWFQTGTFDIGPIPSVEVNWQVTALHPLPIVIDPGNPQHPTLRFRTSSSFTWIPGTYRVTVRAHRVVSHEWLEQSIYFDLSDEGVAEIIRQGDRRFTDFLARTTE